MDRRRFLLTSLAGALAAPLAAEAQQAKLVRIGFLSGNPASDTEEAFDAFRMKLRTLGYAEGRNLVESRHAESRYERLPQLVAELVRLCVDVIFAYGTPGSLAAKNATTTIPIVFAGVADPLEIGLVATVSTPGANVTGVMSNNPELSAKRVSLLKEAVPAASRLAVLANPEFKITPSMLAETRLAARALGVEVKVVEIRRPQDMRMA